MNIELEESWLSTDIPSEYYQTWEGQVEYFLVKLFCEAFRRNLKEFPMNWSGAYNGMRLYLTHPYYSPFVDNPSYGLLIPKDLEWKLSNATPYRKD